MPLNRCGSVSDRFSVWFSRVSAAPKAATVDVRTSMPPGSSAASCCASANDEQRGPALRPGLRQQQRADWEIESSETDLARNLDPWSLIGVICVICGLPLETAGDHQVNDQEEVVIHLPDDALAETLEPAHAPALNRVDRRIDRTDEERARDANTLQPLPDDAGAERVEVELDVRQFRHFEGLRS